jgi:hypothetical protein
MSRNTSDGRETEVGEAGPPILVDQDVRLGTYSPDFS